MTKEEGLRPYGYGLGSLVDEGTQSCTHTGDTLVVELHIEWVHPFYI
jgi:hypothetical protein